MRTRTSGGGQSVKSYYDYDRRGRLVSYTPGLPVGYGSITYTWNNLGQKTTMTVPLGFTGTRNARMFAYSYDRTGRQVGTYVVPTTVTSNATLAMPDSFMMRERLG